MKSSQSKDLISQQKLAEVKSHLSTRSSFERLISEVEDYAIILLDANGIIATWNKGAQKIKGYTPEEIIGKSFRVFYTMEDRETKFPEGFLEQARTEGKANHEGWRLRKDGQRFWGNVTITAIHSDSGEVTGFLKLTRDLTERKLADERYNNYVEDLQTKNAELRTSEAKYHRMVSELVGYSIIFLDPDGKVQDWNKGAEKLKGYKADEIIGKSFRLFYTQEDKESNLPTWLLQQAVANGSVAHEGWRVRKNGSRFWANVVVSALKDDKGDVLGYTKITKDLTALKIASDRLTLTAEELRESNNELKESEERYHRMISEVEDYAILLLDKNGIVQNWNAGAEKIKGYTESEIVGKSFKTFYLKEDVENGLPDLLLNEAAQTGKANHSGWRKRKDGSKFWGNVAITALHNTKGEIIGFSKVTRDLTQQKLAEDQMIANNRKIEDANKQLARLNEGLSSYAFIVSHDLKEPVRKIQVFASRQKEPGKTLEQVLDFSDRISKSAARMQYMMEDLLEYSQMIQDVEQRATVDLNIVISEVVTDLEVLIHENDAKVDWKDLPQIQGIGFQIQQLFQNLITNSIKFAAEGKRPTITIRSRKIKGAESGIVDASPDSDYHEVTVSDNGVGFEQQYAKKIFEVFQRLQPTSASSGSGIGLAIVKAVMTNHNGLVAAESEPGEGTTFRLLFPVSK